MNQNNLWIIKITSYNKNIIRIMGAKVGGKISSKELVKRYILFIVGLFFSGLGVAVTKHGELGVTPISSIPNIVSMKVDIISFGMLLTKSRKNSPTSRSEYVVFGLNVSIIERVSRG